MTSANVKFYRGTSSQAVELTDTATVDSGTLRDAPAKLIIGNGLDVSGQGVRAFQGLLDNMRVFGSQTDGSGVVPISHLEALRVSDLQNVAPACGDPTPPLIQSNVTGTLGNGDWYVSDVQVDWTVTDSESAISEQSGCDLAIVSADTAGTTFTCSATSDGGTATESVTVKRDATPPSATASAGPPANQQGWRKQNVTVTFSGSDAMSGGVTCDPQVVLSTEGLNQSAAGRCYDAAG